MSSGKVHEGRATVRPLARRVVFGGDFAHRRETVAGGDEIVVVAGPCSVEGRDMLLQTANSIATAGASALRGGAFKPRTSPFSFQGLGAHALELLAEARRTSGLPVVTEVMDVRTLDLVCEYADVVQIGARSMQNFPLLTEVVHPHPESAQSDGRQSLTLEEFNRVMQRARPVARAVGRRIREPNASLTELAPRVAQMAT